MDIVGQDSRGTNNVFKYKQLLKFLENRLGDKASWKYYKLSKHNPLSKVLSRRKTPKKLGFSEAELIEGNEEDGPRLSSFCVVLFLLFES